MINQWNNTKNKKTLGEWLSPPVENLTLNITYRFSNPSDDNYILLLIRLRYDNKINIMTLVQTDYTDPIEDLNLLSQALSRTY